MSKIDELIKRMMLRYPTLYPTRFEAFAELMTNSGFEWVGGELVEVFKIEDATPASMLEEVAQELAEARNKAASEKCEALHALNRRFVIEAERRLRDAEHVAVNIDVYASDYTTCDYRQAWAWLHHTDRHGVSEYWNINNVPDDITPEWREAVYQWLMFIMPPANNLMGINRPEGFEAIPRYAATFDWLKAKCDEFAPKYTPEQIARMQEVAAEIMAELKAGK